MSKIICDVCGTSYQETATQCPICGCVRSGEPVTISGDTNDAQVSPVITYTHVKGGRFSKTNVKKRNAGKAVYSTEAAPKAEKKVNCDKKVDKTDKKGEKALVATVVVLLLAITAIVIYIACSFLGIQMPFGNTDKSDSTTDSTEQTTESTEPSETTEGTVLQIPCEGLAVAEQVVELTSASDFMLLEVVAYPENQTEAVTFSSEDVTVATVDTTGRVEAVGPGQTIIYIMCGDYETECRVVCNFQEETTAPTVSDVTYSESDFTFYNDDEEVKDVTFPSSSKTFKLYTGEIPVELIRWESDNENVVTFTDGVLTFVGTGTANVTATYGDMTYECIIRVY